MSFHFSFPFPCLHFSTFLFSCLSPQILIPVSASLDLLFVFSAHSAFLVPCLLMYSVIFFPVSFGCELMISALHLRELFEAWLESTVFQRDLFLLQSGSCVKFYFKLTSQPRCFWTTKVG